MADLTGMRVAVAGAGVFGLCVALRTLAAGASVEVWDPAALGDNASGVAAGMIGPVGEVLFDPLSLDHLNLFRAGRDGWLTFEKLAPNLRIDRSGAVLLFSDATALQAAQASLNRIGADTQSPPPSNALWPKATAGASALFTHEDWRLDAPFGLAALAKAIIQRGGVFKPQPIEAEHLNAFDVVILAAGLQTTTFVSLASELAALSPIKGQIVRFDDPRASGPALRTDNLYLSPQTGSILVGATMEVGRNDRRVDDQIIADLRARALRLAPDLTEAHYVGLAGVRAATPDGLPLAGPSSRAGLMLATGARRNGWLLAPLVSEIVVSYLSGGDGGPFAARLDPRRNFIA